MTECAQAIKLSGAEDITISQTGHFAIVSATARKKIPTIQQENGGLYFLDLTNKNYQPILLTENFEKPFAPHGISIYKRDNSYTVAAINHTKEGEFIEIFELIGQELTHHLLHLRMLPMQTSLSYGLMVRSMTQSH